MGEVVINDLEKGLKAVFRMMYLSNCEIEGEEVTNEDKQTLDDLDSIETLENLKDLIQDLLNCKRDLRLSDKSELESRCQQFESMLQKLEGDIRVHIRVEQQLKLHIEAAQARIEELQSGVGVRRVQELEDRLRAREKELDGYRKEEEKQADSNFHHRIMSLDPIEQPKRRTPSSESSLQRLAEVADRRHKALLRLEREVVTLRSALDLKTQELTELRGKWDQMQRDSLRGPSQERLAEKMRLVVRPRVSPERALTDRVSGKRRETEGGRKAVNYSPYRLGEMVRGGKIDISPIPPVGKALHHSRTISERISKVSPSLRCLPKVSIV
jgi:hypothetical protein